MVPRDPQHAERWHLAAAKQGHLDSQLQLCASFLDGRGGPERFTDAAEWCRLASDQGDAEAAFRMANLYAKGEGVEPDRAAANRLYQAAAEGGIAQAQVIVGLDYAADGNLPVDLVQAYRWLMVAASSGTPDRDFTDVVELREHVRARLTADQLAEARRIVLEGNGRSHRSHPSSWNPRPTVSL